MRFFYAIFMLCCSVVSMFYATRIIYNKGYKSQIYRCFTITSFFSSLWSLGYGVMYITDKENVFVLYRTIGITGLLGFLILGQWMLSILSNNKKQKWWIIAQGLVGLYVISLVHRRDNIIITWTENGFVTAFSSNYVAIVYTLYTVVVAFSFIAITLYMLRPIHPKRVNAFGRKFLVVEGLIIFGMVFDTVLPAVGINFNIPSTSMIQFVSLDLIYHAVHSINKNQLGLQNMTEYIYQTMKAPIFVFDKDHNLKFANKMAREVFDFNMRENVSYRHFWRDIFEIESPKDIGEDRETKMLTLEYAAKGLRISAFIDPIFDEYDDYLGYIAMATDVTSYFEFLEKAEEAQKEAIRANRAKSVFLANMSHEIRTPMNSILGFSELALQENLDDNTREVFNDIRSSAEILLSTINDILDFTKIESGKMELVEEEYYSSKLIKEVTTVIGMQAKNRGLAFENIIDSNFPSKLYGDMTKIREILINILNNGIKYTNKGYVKLECKLENIVDGYAHIELIISDSGIGIKADDVDKIFDSFQRVDMENTKQTEGTGLGLAITKGFIDLMGGTVDVQSKYGVGTTFTIRLKQKIVNAEPIEAKYLEAKDKIELVNIDGMQILAVDDNKVNLKVITKIMARYGVTIDTADSGEKAIKMCEEKEYDLVFMDQMMPIMDGVEAMHYIRELENGYEFGGPRKIVALTANAINGAKDDLIEVGFDGFIAKPINMDQLNELLEELKG